MEDNFSMDWEREVETRGRAHVVMKAKLACLPNAHFLLCNPVPICRPVLVHGLGVGDPCCTGLIRSVHWAWKQFLNSQCVCYKYPEYHFSISLQGTITPGFSSVTGRIPATPESLLFELSFEFLQVSS